MKTFDNDAFFSEVEALLSAGDPVWLRVQGRSMHPLLRDGTDCVELRPAEADSLRRGDIAFFRHRGGHVLHRIVALHPLTARGDNVWGLTACPASGDILAIVRAVRRPGGRTIDCRSLRWHAFSRLRLLLRPAQRLAAALRHRITH